MFQRMMTGALIAGIGAGLLAAVLHFAFIQPLILQGEQYESGARVHFAGVADQAPPAMAGHAHDHAHGHDSAATTGGTGADHTQHVAAQGANVLTRDALTVAFTTLIYVAYGALMTAGFGIAAQFGARIDATRGVLWGLAGFASVQLAPAMGLSPELPGALAADLGARQVWWWLTVAGTAGGIALIAFGRTPLRAAAGVALIAAPHVIGAPVLDGYFGVAPPELAAAFSARVLGVGLTAWVVLGWLAGWQWSRRFEAD